jgi:tryptophan-rich sensory protein
MSISIADLRKDSSSLPKASSYESLDDSKKWSPGDQLRDGSLWIYIVVAIVVLVLIMCICRSGLDKKGGDTSWWDRLSKYDWGESTTLWGLLMIVGVILFAWAISRACLSFPKGDSRCYIVVGGFAVSMIAIVAVFSVMFSAEKDVDNTGKIFNNAKYIALFASAIGFITLTQMWNSRNARVAMVPYLVWISALTVFIWKMASEANSV